MSEIIGYYGVVISHDPAEYKHAGETAHRIKDSLPRVLHRTIEAAKDHCVQEELRWALDPDEVPEINWESAEHTDLGGLFCCLEGKDLSLYVIPVRYADQQ